MRTVLFLAFCFSISWISAQNREESKAIIFYNYRYSTDSTRAGLNNELMALILGDKQSIYTSYQKIRKDSIVRSNFNRGILEINFATLPHVDVFHQVYRDFDKDSMYVVDRIATKDFIYPVQKIAWRLGSQRKIIDGYGAQNAFCKVGSYSFEAWFTTELVPGEGPYIFKGLPGLILNVADDKNRFLFEFAGIKKISVSLERSKLAIKTTQAKFRKARKDFFLDPIGQSALYMNRGLQISDESKKRIKENVQKVNVFLN